MNVKMVYHNGQVVPILVCDVCNKRIKDASMANALYDPLDPDTILAVHKKCDRGELEELLDAARTERFRAWLPLPVVLHNLVHNTHIDLEEAAQLAKALDW
jgi:hypothetical protein